MTFHDSIQDDDDSLKGRREPKRGSPLQVGVDVVIAVVLRQVDQDARSTATLPGPAEAAVAYTPAGGALPVLEHRPGSVRFSLATAPRHVKTSARRAFSTD